VKLNLHRRWIALGCAAIAP